MDLAGVLLAGRWPADDGLQDNDRGLGRLALGRFDRPVQLEDGKIVLSSALELENLDYNELAAALDEIDVTLAQQVAKLAELSKAVKSVPPQGKS